MEDGVGIEKFAEYCFKTADKYVKEITNNRCFATRVEVFEHEKNSAIYEDKYNIMSWASEQNARINRGETI